VVEIGVFGGRSLLPMALAVRELKRSQEAGGRRQESGDRSQESAEIPHSAFRIPHYEGRVYGIDPWTKAAALEGVNDEANDKWWASLDLGAIYAAAADEIARQKVSEEVFLLKLTSVEAVPLFRKIDFLHVDGNHSELASCRDVDLYLPKVPEGGTVWMDDTNWATTQKAVRRVEECCRLVETFSGEGIESRRYVRRS
jgi:hypothetical protein